MVYIIIVYYKFTICSMDYNVDVDVDVDVGVNVKWILYYSVYGYA